ncbi:MAG: hypothetical protein GY729_17385 [Desulfobacteraceae bacterium]|nr:hypothetical protein [Desulfobacteraceae bacterium]
MSVSFEDQINIINANNGVTTSSTNASGKEEDVLGRDTFLTMLVAQLKNQDPLNPMDGTDFSAQLAEFSQLEQLMNLGDSMQELSAALTDKNDVDATGFVGKEISGKVDSLEVSEGVVTGGYYNVTRAGDIRVSIYDADGTPVRTLYEGQKISGAQSFSWDGKNSSGISVADGTYTYSVMANTGSGFAELPNTITGLVQGVVYNDGTPFLYVDGALVSPDSLIAVKDPLVEDIPSVPQLDNPLTGYIGKYITTSTPRILIEDGSMYGGSLTFQVEVAEETEESEETVEPGEATITIYDATGKLIRTITLSEEETAAGTNSVEWDGLDDSGDEVSDGLYAYNVEIENATASIETTGEVLGIKYINQTQFLVQDPGRMVALSSITAVDG